MSFPIERWHLLPKELPRVWRYCPRCALPRPFICSERFRVNAQKKYLDVWLIYRCARCESTWNHSILWRRNATSIDAATLDSFHRNDQAKARSHALDLACLRRHARVEMGTSLAIERELSIETSPHGYTVQLVVPSTCELRLDRLLCMALAIGRDVLKKRYDRGALRIRPEISMPLRKRVRDGQEICFLDGFDEAVTTRSISASRSQQSQE
jgi:hypothetical protein